MSRQRLLVAAGTALALGLLAFLLCSAPDGKGTSPLQRSDADVADLPPVHEPVAPGDPRLRGSAPTEPAPEPAEVPVGYSIDGVVLDVDGEPPTRACVQLEREERTTVPDRGFGTEAISLRTVGRRWTDGGGRFAFADLAPGTYRVVALAPPGRLATAQDVTIDDADIAVELVWRRPVSVTIAVVDPAGQPVVDARASVQHGTTRATGSTDEHGLARLAGLDPAALVTLLVDPPRERDLFAHRDNLWEVQDTRVVLERALRITGRVVDENGEVVPKARVSRRVDDGNRIVTADASGAFTLVHLRPGPVVLQARPPGSWRDVSPDALQDPVTVQAGTEGVELVVRLGVTLVVQIADWPEATGGTLRLDATGTDDTRSVKISEQGSAQVFGLIPDETYALFGTPRKGESFVYHPGVRPGPELISLLLQEAEPVFVEVTKPDDVEVRHVWVWGGPVVRRAPYFPTDGTWRIPGVPPGVYTAQAFGVPKEWGYEAHRSPLPPTHSGSARVAAGDRVVIRLEPVDPK